MNADFLFHADLNYVVVWFKYRIFNCSNLIVRKISLLYMDENCYRSNRLLSFSFFWQTESWISSEGVQKLDDPLEPLAYNRPANLHKVTDWG